MNKVDIDGIGFMFSKDDPFVGIDIDHCIQEGALTSLAEDVIETVNSYTEYSPSGDGIHIIAKGKLPLKGPGTGRKNVDIGWKYIDMDAILLSPLWIGVPVEDRTEELKVLFEKYLKEKPKPERNKTLLHSNEKILLVYRMQNYGSECLIVKVVHPLKIYSRAC